MPREPKPLSRCCDRPCACQAWTTDPDGTQRHWGYAVEPPGPTFRAILGRKVPMSSLHPTIVADLRTALEQNADASSTWDKPRAAVRYGDTYYVFLDKDTVTTVTTDELWTIRRTGESWGIPLQVPSPIQFFYEGWRDHFVFRRANADGTLDPEVGVSPDVTR